VPSTLSPPIIIREKELRVFPEGFSGGNLWGLVASLISPRRKSITLGRGGKDRRECIFRILI